MIDAAHTPGPWVIDDQSLQVAEIERDYGPQDPARVLRVDAPASRWWGLATVVAGEEGDQADEDHRAVEVGFANARLIAASPDLLSAAKKALAALKVQGGNGPNKAALRALAAAIAKAEG